MTAQTTDDRTPDSIRDAFEAMIAFLTILIGGPMPRAWPEIAAVAARAIGSQARTTGEADRAVAALASFRDLIQRAAEEHNRRASAAAADMPAERIREMRERCDKATPGPWAVRDEGREGIGIDQAGINNIGSDRFILNEGANGTRADLDFAAHAREDLPAAIAEIERLNRLVVATANADPSWVERCTTQAAEIERLATALQAERAAWQEASGADSPGHLTAALKARRARLTAELAARVPALFDGPPRTLYQPNGPDGRPEDAGAPADASLEARALDAARAHQAAFGPPQIPYYTPEPWIAVVRAVDASRPASPSAADLRAITVDWPRTNARRGALMDREDAGTLTAEETTELADLQRLADLLVDKMHRDASRPGLTEEQADAIALGCLQVREDLQRHAIKRAILRASRGETFEVRHPDGTRDRVEPPDPRATLHDGNPESPFAPGSLAAGSATEDRILDRKRGGK